jgi:hypothetical protein
MEMNEFEEVTLATIGHGMAPKLFQRELRQVLRNIADTHTPAEEVRKIQIEISILPGQSRKVCAVRVKCKSILAGAEPIGGELFVQDDESGPVGLIQDPRQDELPLKEARAN